MSVLDRLHKMEGQGLLSQEKSSTLILDEPATVRRLRMILSHMTSYLSRMPDHKYSKFSWVLEGVADDMLSELADSPEEDVEKLGQWFADFGKVFTWCGNGDASVLPESVRDYLVGQYPLEVKAIEAANTSAEGND